ncbi:MAG: hypothetical protein V2G41_09800 [bacterium JZ-2024 1]
MIVRNAVLGDVELKIVSYAVSYADNVMTIDVEGPPPLSRMTIRLEDEEFLSFYVGGFKEDAELERLVVRKMQDLHWNATIEEHPYYLPDYSSGE